MQVLNKMEVIGVSLSSIINSLRPSDAYMR